MSHRGRRHGAQRGRDTPWSERVGCSVQTVGWVLVGAASAAIWLWLWQQNVAEVGEFDAAAAAMIMNSPRRVAVMFDPPGDCNGCDDLTPVWQMLADSQPQGTTWRVKCGDHPSVCVERQALAGLHNHEGYPLFQVWSGEEWWQYTGPNVAAELMKFILGSLRGAPSHNPQLSKVVAEEEHTLAAPPGLLTVRPSPAPTSTLAAAVCWVLIAHGHRRLRLG